MQWQRVFWLTHSRGVGKIIKFKGLDTTFRIIPVLLTNFNFLTRQPYYFLKDIEAIGCLDLGETGEWQKGDKETTAVADNYLFEYSLQNPNSRLTARFYSHDPMREYGTLFLDKLAEKNPEYIVVDNGNVRFHSPDFIARRLSYGVEPGYFQSSEIPISSEIIKAFNRAYDDFRSNLNRFVKHQQKMGKIEIEGDPYTADELEKLYFINPDNEEEVIESFRNYGFPQSKLVTVEFIECRKIYDQVLLEFYFAALRDETPLTQFKNYYNIIEYFFEDAAIEKLKNTSVVRALKDDLPFEYNNLRNRVLDFGKEDKQIVLVLEQYVSSNNIASFLQSLGPNVSKHFTSNLPGFHLPPLNHSSTQLVNDTATRIYEIRNSIFHSKRRQNPIVPFNKETDDFISRENVLMKFIAQQVILSTGTEFTPQSS